MDCRYNLKRAGYEEGNRNKGVHPGNFAAAVDAAAVICFFMQNHCQESVLRTVC